MHFVARLLSFTFRRSFVYTDRAAIIIGPLMTASFALGKDGVPEALEGLLAVGVVLTAGGALLARLLAAPYFIWREDTDRIAALEIELSSEERRQRDVYRQALDEKRIDWLKFLSPYKARNSWPWLMNADGPRHDAALLSVEPGFTDALEAWLAASRHGEQLTNQRDVWFLYQRVPNEVKESILNICRDRANMAVDTLFSILTGNGTETAGKLQALIASTEDRLQSDLRIMKDSLSEPLPSSDAE